MQIGLERNRFARCQPAVAPRALDYEAEWAATYRARAFDFLLNDSSLFQFSRGDEDQAYLRYAYLQCPFGGGSYEEFLAERGLRYEAVGDGMVADFEAVTSAAAPRRSPIYLRYDYDPSLYRRGVHPASHIHVGYGTEIRVNSTRILTPRSFLLFVIRQAYPAVWSRLLLARGAKALEGPARMGLHLVPTEFDELEDRAELRLQ